MNSKLKWLCLLILNCCTLYFIAVKHLNEVSFLFLFAFADKAATNWLRQMSNGKQCSKEKQNPRIHMAAITATSTPPENQDMSTAERKRKLIQRLMPLSNEIDGDKGNILYSNTVVYYFTFWMRVRRKLAFLSLLLFFLLVIFNPCIFHVVQEYLAIRSSLRNS